MVATKVKKISQMIVSNIMNYLNNSLAKYLIRFTSAITVNKYTI